MSVSVFTPISHTFLCFLPHPLPLFSLEISTCVWLSWPSSRVSPSSLAGGAPAIMDAAHGQGDARDEAGEAHHACTGRRPRPPAPATTCLCKDCGGGGSWIVCAVAVGSPSSSGCGKLKWRQRSSGSSMALLSCVRRRRSRQARARSSCRRGEGAWGPRDSPELVANWVFILYLMCVNISTRTKVWHCNIRWRTKKSNDDFRTKTLLLWCCT
jgi:hypothetical protein